MYLSFNHNLEVMENTTYIEKCLEFDAELYSHFHKKNGTVVYITKKSRFFFLKKGVLLCLKINDFGWKRGIFRPNSAKKGVFFKTWVRAWHKPWSGVGGRDSLTTLVIELYNWDKQFFCIKILIPLSSTCTRLRKLCSIFQTDDATESPLLAIDTKISIC